MITTHIVARYKEARKTFKGTLSKDEIIEMVAIDMRLQPEDVIEALADAAAKPKPGRRRAA